MSKHRESYDPADRAQRINLTEKLADAYGVDPESIMYNPRTYTVSISTALTRRVISDAETLNELAWLLSAPEWPGSSGLEDIAEIVSRTGRVIKDDPSVVWERH